MNIDVNIHSEVEVDTFCYGERLAWHLSLKEEGKGHLEITFFGEGKFRLDQAIKEAESRRTAKMLDDVRRRFIPRLE